MEELKAFIRESLFEISEGLREANEAYKKSRNIADNAFLLQPMKGDNTGIHFDVAVTTKAETDLRGEGKVGIKVLGVDAGVEHQQARENVSRIRFTVIVHHWIG